jgi:hypothetical protein
MIRAAFIILIIAATGIVGLGAVEWMAPVAMAGCGGSC